MDKISASIKEASEGMSGWAMLLYPIFLIYFIYLHEHMKLVSFGTLLLLFIGGLLLAILFRILNVIFAILSIPLLGPFKIYFRKYDLERADQILDRVHMTMLLVLTLCFLPISYYFSIFAVNTYAIAFNKPNPSENMDAFLSPDFKEAFDSYVKNVGVLPNEFLRFSKNEQEVYTRGVMDGQMYLAEYNKDSDLHAFIHCLNNNLSAIVSRAELFLRNEGEQEFLVPWSLSRLVGKTCPKEIRTSSSSEDIQYTEATTEWFLLVDEQNEEKAAQKQDMVDRAFIRGVLDGKVFYLHGHRYPKLKEYLSCLSQPDSLRKILFGMRMATFFGDDLEKTRAYHVTKGEALACKDIYESNNKN